MTVSSEDIGRLEQKVDNLSSGFGEMKSDIGELKEVVVSLARLEEKHVEASNQMRRLYENFGELSRDIKDHREDSIALGVRTDALEKFKSNINSALLTLAIAGVIGLCGYMITHLDDVKEAVVAKYEADKWIG